jgi:hypothetical protein
MVGSNKMRNHSPNKVGMCSEDALVDSYVCSGTFFRRVIEVSLFLHYPGQGTPKPTSSHPTYV